METIFRCGDESELFGIVTPPDGSLDPARPAVVFLNAGMVRRIGTRRLSVKLARALSQEGFLCVRFDFAGLGDSPARSGSASFMEGACADLRTILDYLEGRYGVTNFVTVGLCSGADVGLAAANQDARIRGVVQINAHIHKNLRYYVHQLGRSEWWRQVIAKRMPWLRQSSKPGKRLTWGPPPTQLETLNLLKAAADRDVNLMVVYTTGTISYDRQFIDVYNEATFNEHFLCVRRMPSNHVVSPMHDQAYVRRRIFDWCRSTWPASPNPR